MKYNRLLLVGLIIPLLILNNCSTKKDKNSGTSNTTSESVTSANPLPGISIHDAALNGQIGNVTALLKSGVKTDTLDQDGRTPLMYAAFNGHTEIISTLVKNGADVNLCDSNGTTALMMASSGPYPEAVKILLDNYANPDITDKSEHFTALMYAASEGQLEVVKLLLARQANPFMKDIDGDDALTFAVKNGHSAVVALLRPLKK